MFTAFLIKYAEIGVKGKNRYLFEDMLVRQMKYALKKCEGRFVIRKSQGRIFAEAQGEFDFDEAVERLRRVFGISGICPVVYAEDEGFEKLCQRVTAYVDEVYPDKHRTFKVNARRARKDYPIESMEINALLGEAILKAYPEMSVDVHKPDIMLNVKKYIFTRKSYRVPAACPWGQGGKPCCFCPAASTLLWRDI